MSSIPDFAKVDYAGKHGKRKFEVKITLADALAGTPASLSSGGHLELNLLTPTVLEGNPHWVDELRPHTGQHPAVRDYVLGQPGAAEFLDTYHQLLDVVIDGYRREGKRYMTVAIGCTGGRHRSVMVSEKLGHFLRAQGYRVLVQHRDVGK